jgi:hypothetical protein
VDFISRSARAVAFKAAFHPFHCFVAGISLGLCLKKELESTGIEY